MQQPQQDADPATALKPKPARAAGRAILGFALIFAAILLLHARLLRLPYFWDEAGYFVPAARDLLLSGSLIPKTTLSNAHPPLVMLWLALWWKLCGYAPTMTRTAMLALAAFGLLGVYRLAERVAGRQVALASLVLTALYPVIFVQSSLAQLDIAAFAFTAWAVFFYVTTRRAASIGFFALATLCKETAFIAPLALGCWELLCHTSTPASAKAALAGDPDSYISSWARRWCLFSGGVGAAFAQLLAAVPLTAWYGFHVWRTGRLFGSEFLLYNVSGTVSAARIPLALLERLWHAAGYMNLYMLTAAALLAWRLPSLAPRQTQKSSPVATPAGGVPAPGEGEPRSAVDPRVQAVFLLLIAAYVLMLSLLGGAALARYMIPVIPLVIVLAVAEIRRAFSFWRAWCAVCAAGFIVALLVAPPWRIAPEDNLTYVKYVRLHQQAAAYLEQHYARDRILTAWPASDELNRPFLGYVSSPLSVVRIDDFSGTSLLNAARQRQAFDVAFVFSTKYDPVNPLNRLDWWNRVQVRYFDYHRDLSPALIASMLHGRIVWQRSAGAEWAAIIELDSIRNADASPHGGAKAEVKAVDKKNRKRRGLG
jgi:hypothetical protein